MVELEKYQVAYFRAIDKVTKKTVWQSVCRTIEEFNQERKKAKAAGLYYAYNLHLLKKQ